MTKRILLSLGSTSLMLLLASCSRPDAAKTDTQPATPPRPAGSYHVYITNERSNDITIIDSVTNDVVATAPTGKRPRGIHASPDGKTLYIALSGSPIAPPGVDESTLPPPDKAADGIGVFDVKERKLVKTIAGGSDPEEFSLSKDGSLLYSSNEDTGETSIIDLAAGSVAATLKVGPEDSEPEGVTTSPDGKFVYVTAENEGMVFVVDTEARKVIKSIKVGARPRSVAFSPDSTKAYVTCENDGTLAIVDAVKHVKTGDIKIGKPTAPENIKPMKVILSPDAKTAYVSAGRGKMVFIIDTATDKVTGSIEAGQRPWGIDISPDGKYLYTANGPSNDVTVIDLSTNMVLKTIKAGQSPWGVLVVQD